MKTYLQPVAEIYKLKEEDVIRTSVTDYSNGVADADDNFDDSDWE